MKLLNDCTTQPDCFNCRMRSPNFFCDLSAATLKTFESLKITSAYPKGATLFMEGHPSNGIYMLCRGRVKLSTGSRDGKIIILRIAEAGEVLGLQAIVSDTNYGATAEVLETCQVNFVRKEDFLRFIRQNAEAGFGVIQQLSYQYHAAYLQVRSFGLSHTAADKLANLLLEWCKTDGGQVGIHLKVSYTHEEIAEMIGTSRETVTRLFKDFRSRRLITFKGSDLIVHDLKRLDATIGAPARASF